MNHDSFKSAKPVKSKKRIPINTKHRFDFNLKTENLSKTSTIVVPEPQDRPKPIGLPKLSEERDLLFHRLKDSDFPCFPVFSDYKKGRSSHKLYVKNISKNVTRDELTQIYSSLLDKEVKRQPFGVRHLPLTSLGDKPLLLFQTRNSPVVLEGSLMVSCLRENRLLSYLEKTRRKIRDLIYVLFSVFYFGLNNCYINYTFQL